MSYERIAVNQPSWQSVMVTRHLPAEISGLERLSKNLWWCWNEDAKALFKLIDEDVWHRSGHNPMDVLDTVSLKRFKVLAQDKDFLKAYNKVMQEFDNYMALKADRKDPSIA